ncbi:phage tail tape measure protein [uncultured Polaribacter sp.]|uniref:phage tail tape measure protein n=1 Tax=uncultured Polaribacter sp. TaxID=174711 RepID=UPI00262EB142|nr:phage tail tape measure protein [uncultured Polaribacter sp.]
MANKKITRQLSIYINGKQVKNNLFSIGKEMGKLRGQIKHLTRGTKEYEEKSAELRKVTKVWNDIQKEIKGVPSLLSKVRKELGLVGLTIASVFSINGMINYFKVLHQKVDLLRELKHTILQITELEGRELEIVTAKVKALADTFDTDAKKMTESANALSKQMGIDFTKALDLIEQGFLNGANANGDFLDKVREYPALLKEAGLSAKQSIALMSQEVKKGIYSDKGVDAIKEANLRLREMTPAAAQAIKAIGLSSVSIEKDLSSGKKTIFQVIQDISQRLSLIPPKSKLAGQAVADIFGGPGEDAGFEYLATLHEIDLSLADVTKSTDKYAEAKELEVKANEALNNVWVQLTDTASILHLAWNKLKLQGALVIGFFAKLVGLSDDADGSMQQLRDRITTVIKVVVVAATAFFSYKAALKIMTLWTKIATGDTILHTLAIKANAIGLVFAKGAVFAYKAVIALLSGNLKKATIAMRAFSIATKLSPIGLLVGLITAATVAYALFSKKVDEASVKQQALNDLKKRTASIYGQEEGALKKLLIVAQDETLNKDQREKAIKQINKSYPEYLGNLTLENINTSQVAEAIDLQIVAMKKRAEQKALEQLIDETIKKRREEEAKGLEDHTIWYDYLTSSVKSFGNQAMFSTNMAITASKRKAESLKVLSDKENIYTEEYKKRLQEQSQADAKRLESDKKFKRIRSVLEKTARELRIKNIEKLTNEQLRIEIGKAIERNNKIAGINKKAAEKQAAELKKQKEAELSYREKVLLSSKSLIEQEIIAHKKRLQKAGLFGKERNKLTKLELLVQEKLEAQHQAKIAKIELDATNKFLAKKTKDYNSAKTKRTIAYNDELANLKSLNDAKKLLSKTLSESELNKIKTFEQAKSVLQRQYDAKELSEKAKHLQELVKLYTTALQTGEIEGVDFADKILTEEQKEVLKEQLEQIRLKLSEIKKEKNAISGISEEEEGADLSSLNNVDIFGFTPEQWENSFKQLDEGASKMDQFKQKIGQVEMVLQSMQQAWGMYSKFVAQNEEKQLRALEKSNNKKKDSLKKQLDDGVISQDKYNEEIEKLDTELAKKQAEIEYKQAKRERTAALFSIGANTALGIMKAVASSPWTGGMPWAAIIGAMGALQAGLVLAAPLPDKSGFFQGGFTGDKPIRYDYQDGVAMDTPNGPYHINEWVAPKWMNESPRYAPTIQYLERERLKGPGFFDGGFNRSSSTPAPTFEEENSNETSAINERDEMMMSLLFQLKEQLDRGIKAYNVKDYEDFLRQKEIDQEHEEIYQNTRS